MAAVPKHLTAIIEKIKKNEELEENRNKEVNDVLTEASKLREENARLSDLLLEKEMEKEDLLTKAALKKEEQSFKALEKKLVMQARQKWIRMTEELEDKKEKEVESRWTERRAHISTLKSKVQEIKSQSIDTEDLASFEQMLLCTLGNPPEPEVVEPVRSPLRSPLLGEKPNKNNKSSFEIEEEFIDLEIMQQLETLTESWSAQDLMRCNQQSKQNQLTSRPQNVPSKPNPQFTTKNSNFGTNHPKISPLKSNFSLNPTPKSTFVPIQSQKSNYIPNPTQTYNYSPNKNISKNFNLENNSTINSQNLEAIESRFVPKKPKLSNFYSQEKMTSKIMGKPKYFTGCSPSKTPYKSRDIQTARDVYQTQNSTTTSAFQFKKPLPRNCQGSNSFNQSTWQNQEEDFELMDSEDCLTTMDSTTTNPYPKNIQNQSKSYSKSHQKSTDSYSNQMNSKNYENPCESYPKSSYQKSSSNTYNDLVDSSDMYTDNNSNTMDSYKTSKSYQNSYSKYTDQINPKSPMDSNSNKMTTKTFSPIDSNKYTNKKDYGTKNYNNPPKSYCNQMDSNPMDSDVYPNSMDSTTKNNKNPSNSKSYQTSYSSDYMDSSPMDSDIYPISMDSSTKSNKNTSNTYKSIKKSYQIDSNTINCSRIEVQSNKPSFSHSQDSSFYSSSQNKFPATADFEDMSPNKKLKFVPKQATFNKRK